MKTMTANRGADLTRRQIQQHLKLLLSKKRWRCATGEEVIEYLQQWIVDMPWRSGRKRGGLGRK